MKYIAIFDESEVNEYWEKSTAKELGYQEYNLKAHPEIKVKPLSEEKDMNERPKGEWKFTTHYARRYRVCPFCKAEKEDDRSAGWYYCWNCGAEILKENKE